MRQENQWFHIETYGRTSTRKTKEGGKRATVRGIVGEATREEGYCPHVADAQEPTVLLGDLHELENQITARANQGKNGRKLRPDAHVLLAGTASYPKPCNQLTADDEEPFNKWLTGTVDFLQKEWGARLKAVVLHLDEGFPHIHFYAADLDGLDMKTLHRGKAAEAAADEAGEGKLKAVYKAAMQTYQDDYYRAVGQEMGFSRLGPRRQRLTRQEWKAQQHANQVENEARAKALAGIEAQGKALDARRREYADTLKDNADLREELAKAAKAFHILQNRVKTAQERAKAAEIRAEEAEIVLGASTGLGASRIAPTKSEPSTVLPFAKPVLTSKPRGRGGNDFGGPGL